MDILRCLHQVLTVFLGVRKMDKDWKVKFNVGKLETAFIHFTGIANGNAEGLSEGFDCPTDQAIFTIKMWAESADMAVEMVCSIGRQIGFEVDGDIQIFDSEPDQPPKDVPYGYGISFTPYKQDPK